MQNIPAVLNFLKAQSFDSKNVAPDVKSFGKYGFANFSGITFPWPEGNHAPSAKDLLFTERSEAFHTRSHGQKISLFVGVYQSVRSITF